MILELKDAFVDTSGGKAGALGALLRAGLPVPDGFVVPFAEYRAGVDGCHVEPVAGKPKGPDKTLEKNDCVIGPMPIPAGLRDAIARGLDVLGNPSVAVRSSANSEDTAEASAAGQYDSILAVQGAGAVTDAVQACWASLHSGRAIDYRLAIDRDAASRPAAMAVLVQ
ncbi:MAG: PEP/pyruvate-binding domain-containing protein, partial [Specibacter sp.]